MLDSLAFDHDPEIAREFEVLGTEVAVPIFDDDQLLGVLTFSGKITGEPLAGEELELVYYLMAQTRAGDPQPAFARTDRRPTAVRQ